MRGHLLGYAKNEKKMAELKERLNKEN